MSWPVPAPAPFVFVLLEAILILSSAAVGERQGAMWTLVSQKWRRKMMEKNLEEGLAALIVSSRALKWAVIWRVSLYFHDKSKQPSWGEACKLKNQAQLVYSSVGGLSPQASVGLGLSSGGRRKCMGGRAPTEMGELSLYRFGAGNVHPVLCERYYGDQWLLGAQGRGVQRCLLAALTPVKPV